MSTLMRYGEVQQQRLTVTQPWASSLALSCNKHERKAKVSEQFVFPSPADVNQPRQHCSSSRRR